MQKFNNMKKFDSWRLEKLQQFAPLACEMHYHRCSDYSYTCTAELLRSLLIRHVESGGASVCVHLSREVADAIFSFLNEMKFAYIHPRSTSHRFIMQAETRFRVSSSC